MFSIDWVLCKCVFIYLIISCLVLPYSQSVLYSTCLTWIVGLVESCTVNSWQFQFYFPFPSTWRAVYPISSLPTASLRSPFCLHMKLTFGWGHGIWKWNALVFTCAWEKWWVLLGRHCLFIFVTTPSSGLISGLVMTIMLILTLLVEDFLMYVVFMYGLCLQVSDWLFSIGKC